MSQVFKCGSTTDGWEYYIETDGESTNANKYFRIRKETGEMEYFDTDIKMMISRHRYSLELLS